MERRGFLGSLLGLPAAAKALAETPKVEPPPSKVDLPVKAEVTAISPPSTTRHEWYIDSFSYSTIPVGRITRGDIS